MLKDRQRGVIAGIGSALVDILVYEDDEFLKKTNAAKGGMTLVDQAFIEKTLALTSANPVIVPGGSACNTAVGIGKLGGKAQFIGKCGRDDMAALFEEDLIKSNVQPTLFKTASPTGRVLSIITPDAQRSMFTFLGASSEMTMDEVAGNHYSNVMIVHLEGYLLFNKELVYAALQSAQKVGARVSLDLASYTVVEESKDILDDIVDRFVDILIANEDEARAFTGCTDEKEAIGSLSQRADIAVLKVGERGSYVAGQEKIIKIEPMSGQGPVVDTTGAGDLWASGFLYGIANGYPLDICGNIGSACGYEVCQVIGADIPDEGWERIKRLI
jgi:sugar/nucleoside kinase (ribokinase family)